MASKIKLMTTSGGDTVADHRNSMAHDITRSSKAVSH